MKPMKNKLSVYASATDRQLGIATPLETFENPLWWQDKGLSFTASGYGSKIPTVLMVKHHNRMKRVYLMIYSNSGTCYILDHGKRLIITD